MRYQALLFDFDGTIVPSLHLWMAAYQRTLREHAVILSEEETIARCFYRPYRELTAEFELSIGGEQFGERMLAHLLELFTEIRLFPHAREVLELCQREGIPLGCVSSAPRENLHASLSRLGIRELFQVITSGDDVERLKPHPDPVSLTAEQLGVPVEHCLMVGDYTVDIISGRSAGAKTALFFPQEHERYYTEAFLAESAPDFIVRCHSELLVHLQSVFEKSLTP